MELKISKEWCMAAAGREGDSEVGAGFESAARPSRIGLYDPECHRLAEHFLQDEPYRSNAELYKKRCAELASDIQQTVEDWCLLHPGHQGPSIPVATREQMERAGLATPGQSHCSARENDCEQDEGA